MGKTVVLDTNIIISSIFWGNGNSHRIVELIIEQRINNFTSQEMLDELAKVLRIDFEQPEEFVQRQLDLVKNYSEIAKPFRVIKAVKDDPKDDMILECASSCKAKYIITGDNHLLSLKEFEGIKIVTTREFLDIFTRIDF